VLVSGDGRHVGIVADDGQRLFVLRDGGESYARDNLLEIAGMAGEPVQLDRWPGARCNEDFCAIQVHRGDRDWNLLIGRGRDAVPERALAAACDRADLVIADRWLPRSCRPRWFKADRRLLGRSGGITIDLTGATVRTVAQGQGEHGWWHPVEPRPFKSRPLGSAVPDSVVSHKTASGKAGRDSLESASRATRAPTASIPY
jgi:competence protein ComEC